MHTLDTSLNDFDVAIALVQQRDQQSLINKLLDILFRYLPNAKSAMYEVFNHDLQVCVYGTGKSSPLSDSPHLLQAHQSRKPVFENLSEKRTLTIFPIPSIGNVSLLLEIEGEDLQPQIPSLTKLILLFRNQYMLLDKNNHDALTSLLNRRAFDDKLNNLVNYQQRRGEESHHCFALFDIDHFKKVNDQFGHLFGDEVLILFAGLMEKTFRHEDMLFRYGGEEFCAILKNINLDTAIIVLDRFRQFVANYSFPQTNITISIGLTAVQQEYSVFEVISNADRALYFAKENGRNQVQCFEQLLSAGKLEKTLSNNDDVELF